MTDPMVTPPHHTSGTPTVDSSLFFEASPVATFVIDMNHVVTHFNRACALTLGIPAERAIGQKGLAQLVDGVDRAVLADLIVDGRIQAIVDDLYQSQYRSSLKVPGAFEGEEFLTLTGRCLVFVAAPLYNPQGEMIGAIETLQDISERKVAESAMMQAQLEVEQLVDKRTAELAEVNRNLQEDVNRREMAERALQVRNEELNALNNKLSEVKEHLIHSEKLASIGQLAAGIAHEINNPIGYIFSNFGTLENYLAQLFEMLTMYESAESAVQPAEAARKLQVKREELDVDFLKEDIPVLMRESKEGIVRVRKIVQDLKDFSHVDATTDWQFANLNQGIESTLNVIHNEIKYKAELIKDLADLPAVQCLPSQLNQVVMNLVFNAAHAIGTERGTITVRTGHDENHAWIQVADTGSGIKADVLPRIFDPFYTTKSIGKGTGLGLSLSYGIVQKHHGTIDVVTELGKGSTFTVKLPLKQPAPL